MWLLPRPDRDRVAPPCEVLLRTYQVVVKGDEAVKDPQDIGHLTMDLCRLMGAALHTIQVSKPDKVGFGLSPIRGSDPRLS